MRARRGVYHIPMQFDNPLKYKTIPEFLSALLDIVTIIMMPIIVLALIYGGFRFIKAQGNPTELEEAKKLFLWVLIGALLVLGASTLSRAIEGTVNEVKRGVEVPYTHVLSSLALPRA